MMFVRLLSCVSLRRMLVAGLILMVAGGFSPCHAQQTGTSEIKVPYALGWGDSPDKIHGMISAVKATETSCMEKSPGKLVIEADGLGIADPLLRKSLFTFRLLFQRFPMSYAIIQTGGKQYRVSEGDLLNVEKLAVEAGKETTFSDVMLVVNGDKISLGSPLVSGASVQG
jgi:hypothetical protein